MPAAPMGQVEGTAAAIVTAVGVEVMALSNDQKQIVGILAFMGIVLLIYEIAGEKPTYYFTVLVFLGVLIKNYDKIKTLK
jgi:hypothetical protein